MESHFERLPNETIELILLNIDDNISLLNLIRTFSNILLVYNNENVIKRLINLRHPKLNIFNCKNYDYDYQALYEEMLYISDFDINDIKAKYINIFNGRENIHSYLYDLLYFRPQLFNYLIFEKHFSLEESIGILLIISINSSMINIVRYLLGLPEVDPYIQHEYFLYSVLHYMTKDHFRDLEGFKLLLDDSRINPLDAFKGGVSIGNDLDNIRLIDLIINHPKSRIIIENKN